MKSLHVGVSALLLASVLPSKAPGQTAASSPAKQKEKTESAYGELGKVPEKARARRNPLEKDPEAAAAGRILYEQRCAECHGDAGEGSKKGPSLRAAEVQKAEPGAIFWILTNGVVRKGMPVWSKLPEPQRWQLVSYIQSLGTLPAKTETSSPAMPQPPAAKDGALPRR